MITTNETSITIDKLQELGFTTIDLDDTMKGTSFEIKDKQREVQLVAYSTDNEIAGLSLLMAGSDPIELRPDLSVYDIKKLIDTFNDYLL